MSNYKTGSANIILSDFPDLDVIRVDDTFYMVSTTMHFMPGCVILRSYNLLDWEFCTYVYDNLDLTEGQTLLDNKGIYGRGMWAASLRFHNNTFYVSFVCNDTQKSYLYTSENITGPWKKQIIPGFYHDMSILFDDDDRVYIASGNTQIHLIEFEKDFSGPKKDGINKIIVQDNKDDVILGYEGSHFYKINGKYYLFFIHMPKGQPRTQACYVSDNIEGPYTGCDVLNTDFGNWNSGVAQGGIVQNTDDKWYAILFQDHGALGRIPILLPVDFSKDFPVFSMPEPKDNSLIPSKVSVFDNNPDYNYEPLYKSGFTDSNNNLFSCWQWNHSPDQNSYILKDNSLTLTTTKLVTNITQASNTLTQRTFTHHCSGTVIIDASKINQGDFTGLCALEGEYAFIGITKEQDDFYLVAARHIITHSPWQMNCPDTEKPQIIKKIKINNSKLTLQLEFEFSRPKDQVHLQFLQKNSFQDFCEAIPLRYTLDQFVGVRFACFLYSTITTGGKATFSNFEYKIEN